MIATSKLPRGHSHRLRRGRYSEPGRVYLITITCRNRQALFHNLARGRCCVRALISVSSWADTWCYVIMPDHIHWLMQLRTGAGLSSTIQKMKSRSSYFLHCADPGIGLVWQRGFHDHALRKEEDLAAVARYVVANPLRAGLTSSLRNYSLWDAVWL